MADHYRFLTNELLVFKDLSPYLVSHSQCLLRGLAVLYLCIINRLLPCSSSLGFCKPISLLNYEINIDYQPVCLPNLVVRVHQVTEFPFGGKATLLRRF
ncbi:hypothetical protein LXL04_013947 [Taraxacum kok-saghyz]